MTRKHSISQYAGTNVRVTPFLLVVLLLTASTQVIATSEQSSMWDDARIGVSGGVLGALEIPLTNETTDSEIVLNYSEMTPVVEVYTATWCFNCVTTEQALDEAIGDSDVLRIHYHRHWSEPEDPFGNNATEYRWESTYGDASTAVGGAPRLAPTTVFGGERMHLGTSPSSSSLTNDYSTSLATGSSWNFIGTARLSISVTESGETKFSWNITDLSVDYDDDYWTFTLTPWLLFVEDSASFPDGSNGVGDYLHVLHDAIELDGLEGSMTVESPPAWDDDDVSAVLLIDWSRRGPSVGDSTPFLPGPGLAAVLLCLIVASLPSRRER